LNSYIATFFTHYGAIKFDRDCKKNGVSSKMMPVPRKLSSSCGTCVKFEAENHDFFEIDEDLEGCYLIAGKDVYTQLFASEK